MGCVEDDVREREAEEFGKGQDLYIGFGGMRKFNKYLHGHSDEGAKTFKFRSGTHSLNEELGRHR